MLFVGDDWAEDHDDIEVVGDDGDSADPQMTTGRAGRITRYHALIAEQAPPEWFDLEPSRSASMVQTGIETDHGAWVAALVAAGYQVRDHPDVGGSPPGAALYLGREVGQR